MSRKHSLKVQRFMILWLAALSVSMAVFLVMPALASAAGSSAWQALVRSEACVQGPDVLLGEIADPVNDMAKRQWKTLSSIKLWKASTRPGRPVTIARGKLADVLKYYMGDMAKNIALPSQLSVQTGGRVIGGQELQARVVAFLTPRAKDLSDDVEFKNFQLPRQIFFPNSYDTLSISLSGDLKAGRNQIKIHGVTPDGKVVARKVGTVFVNVWKAVPVAAKPLNRFERLSQDKISFKRVNLAYKAGVWDGTGGPWRMTRTLGRGEAFTMGHLEPIPLIEKGEQVYLRYQGRKVQLTIKVESLGEAGMGQQVAVKNLQSKKTILATVISDDTVVVR